jgi:putative DNA primase/helicase
MQAIKQMTDTPSISARHHYGKPFDVMLQLTIAITTNPIPVIVETDHATWRRLALVRFPYRFRKPGQPLEGPNDRMGDPTLKARLESSQDNADAIVTWLVEGASAWYADPARSLAVPPVIESDTLAWRGSTDVVMKFWGERLTADPVAAIWTGDLFAEFAAWQREQGMTPWGERRFTEAFSAHSATTGARVEHTGRQVRVSSLAGAEVSRPAGWGPKDSDAFGTAKHNPRDPRTDGRPPVPQTARYWRGARFSLSAGDPSWPESNQARMEIN